FVLLLGLAISTSQWRRAESERRRAVGLAETLATESEATKAARNDATEKALELEQAQRFLAELRKGNGGIGPRTEAPAKSGVMPTLSVAITEAVGVAGWQPAMGEGMAQMLITQLSSLPNFKVLESIALGDLRAER